MAGLVKPNYLLTFFVTTTPSVLEEKVFRLSTESKTPLLFSGSPINFEPNNNMVTYLKNPTDLITILEKELSTI